MTANPQLYTSTQQNFETPGSISLPGTFFYNLHQEFNFDLDAASHEMNAKLPQFLTEDDNALECAWPGARSFCNPPYKTVNKWINKMAEESMRVGREHVVGLVAARTDTAAFHDIIWQIADEIRFVRGRLAFEIGGKPVLNEKTGGVQPATFPSMIVVFRRKPKHRNALGMPLIRCIRQDATFIDAEVPL